MSIWAVIWTAVGWTFPMSLAATIIAVPFAAFGAGSRRQLLVIISAILFMFAIEIALALRFEASDKQWALWVIPILGLFPGGRAVWRIHSSKIFRILVALLISGFWSWTMVFCGLVVSSNSL